MKLLIIAICCVISTCAGLTFAANYFVDVNHPDADDANPGTEDLPFETIQRGIDAAFPGDSVFVKEGIYTPDYSELEMKRSGVQDSLIVFKALGNVVVTFPPDLSKGWRWSTLYNNYLVIDGFEITGSELAIFIQGDYNEIKNCKIHDCTRDGLNLAGGSYNSFINNEIYNTGWNGIYIECRPNDGAKGLADFNVVEFNKTYNNSNHFGINIFPNTAQPQTSLIGNVIRYNQIYNNEGGIYLRNFKDGAIYGNLIYDNFNNGIFLHRHDSSQTSNQFPSNLKIFNNTLINNTPYYSINNVSFIDVEIKNNIFIQNSTNPCLKSDHTAGMDIDYNMYYNTNSVYVIRWGTELLTYSASQNYGIEINGIESNPKLGLDRKPHQTSFAINNGTDLGTTYNLDPEGNIRGADGGWDIGAFEGITTNLSSGKIKIMLEGAFNDDVMNTNLNELSLLPMKNPYDGSPWNYEGGDSVDLFNADIVDWLLIELRTELNNVRHRSVALLNKFGFIANMDGLTPYNFFNVQQDSFYLVIYHRNHLPVVSSQKIFLSSSIVTYDFTTADTKAYGTDAMKDLGGDIYGLYSGDTNNSLIITAADKRPVNNFFSDTGYLKADTNMDGVVNEFDKQIVISNEMNQSYVP